MGEREERVRARESERGERAKAREKKGVEVVEIGKREGGQGPGIIKVGGRWPYEEHGGAQDDAGSNQASPMAFGARLHPIRDPLPSPHRPPCTYHSRPTTFPSWPV